jgi:NADPH:quinone reductase-like Zn-dependent oxidoreductase
MITMKAIIRTEYGSPDVLELSDVEKPAPRDDEVLVKVHASSVNAADRHLLRGDPFLVRLMVGGLLTPNLKVLGADIAGRVEAVGGTAKRFRPGDEVFGDLSDCGWGAFAEYACARENALALKPANLSFAEAAAVPLAGVTALQGLRDSGRIRAGQKVLVNGASGGVGTFAVQIAKSFGADVTGVCSTSKADLVRSIGADRVIDYTKEDFTRKGERYDLILAANGYHSIFDYRRALDPEGIYVAIGGTMPQNFQAMLLGPWISGTGKQKMGSMLTRPNPKDLIFLKGLLESGKIKPVIDRRYGLSKTAEALRYLEEGHARGKIVITVI